MRTSLCIVTLGAVVLAACGGDQGQPIKPPPPPTLPPVAAAMTPPTATSSEPTSPSLPPQKSKLERMTDATKAVADATNAHDAKKFASLYAETATVTVYGAGELNGRTAIEADEQRYFAAFSDLKFGVGRVFANEKDNMAAAEWVITGTQSADFSGVKSQSKKIGVKGISVVWFDDTGLVMKEHRYSDMMTLMGQASGQRDVRAPAELPAAMEVHAAKGTADEAKAIESTKAVYAALEDKKVNDVIAFVTDDSTLDDYSMPAPFKGKRGIASYFGLLVTAFPDLHQTAALMFAADDLVVADLELKGTHKGRFGPIPATRKHVDFHGIEVFQWKDGKLLQGVTYVNSLEVLTQLGKVAGASAPQPSH